MLAEILFSSGKNNILLTRCACSWNIFLPLENIIHIFAPPCNILYIQILHQTQQTTKLNGNLKNFKLTSFQKHKSNPFQSSSSLSICFSSCLYLLFISWAVIFMFHSFWWWFPLFGIDKFRVIAPLTSGYINEASPRWWKYRWKKSSRDWSEQTETHFWEAQIAGWTS